MVFFAKILHITPLLLAITAFTFAIILWIKKDQQTIEDNLKHQIKQNVTNKIIHGLRGENVIMYTQSQSGIQYTLKGKSFISDSKQINISHIQQFYLLSQTKNPGKLWGHKADINLITNNITLPNWLHYHTQNIHIYAVSGVFQISKDLLTTGKSVLVTSKKSIILGDKSIHDTKTSEVTITKNVQGIFNAN